MVTIKQDEFGKTQAGIPVDIYMLSTKTMIKTTEPAFPSTLLEPGSTYFQRTIHTFGIE